MISSHRSVLATAVGTNTGITRPLDAYIDVLRVTLQIIPPGDVSSNALLDISPSLSIAPVHCTAPPTTMQIQLPASANPSAIPSSISTPIIPPGPANKAAQPSLISTQTASPNSAPWPAPMACSLIPTPEAASLP